MSLMPPTNGTLSPGGGPRHRYAIDFAKPQVSNAPPRRSDEGLELVLAASPPAPQLMTSPAQGVKQPGNDANGSYTAQPGNGSFLSQPGNGTNGSYTAQPGNGTYVSLPDKGGYAAQNGNGYSSNDAYGFQPGYSSQPGTTLSPRMMMASQQPRLFAAARPTSPTPQMPAGYRPASPPPQRVLPPPPQRYQETGSYAAARPTSPSASYQQGGPVLSYPAGFSPSGAPARPLSPAPQRAPAVAPTRSRSPVPQRPPPVAPAPARGGKGEQLYYTLVPLGGVGVATQSPEAMGVRSMSPQRAFSPPARVNGSGAPMGGGVSPSPQRSLAPAAQGNSKGEEKKWVAIIPGMQTVEEKKWMTVIPGMQALPLMPIQIMSPQTTLRSPPPVSNGPLRTSYTGSPQLGSYQQQQGGAMQGGAMQGGAMQGGVMSPHQQPRFATQGYPAQPFSPQQPHQEEHTHNDEGPVAPRMLGQDQRQQMPPQTMPTEHQTPSSPQHHQYPNDASLGPTTEDVYAQHLQPALYAQQQNAAHNFQTEDDRRRREEWERQRELVVRQLQDQREWDRRHSGEDSGQQKTAVMFAEHAQPAAPVGQASPVKTQNYPMYQHVTSGVNKQVIGHGVNHAVKDQLHPTAVYGHMPAPPPEPTPAPEEDDDEMMNYATGMEAPQSMSPGALNASHFQGSGVPPPPSWASNLAPVPVSFAAGFPAGAGLSLSQTPSSNTSVKSPMHSQPASATSPMAVVQSPNRVVALQYSQIASSPTMGASPTVYQGASPLAHASPTAASPPMAPIRVAGIQSPQAAWGASPSMEAAWKPPSSSPLLSRHLQAASPPLAPLPPPEKTVTWDHEHANANRTSAILRNPDTASQIVQRVPGVCGLGLLLERTHVTPPIDHVIEIVPGMAAALSGQIRLNDIIVEVNGARVSDLSLITLKKHLLGPEGSPCPVIFKRPPGKYEQGNVHEETIRVTLIRCKI